MTQQVKLWHGNNDDWDDDILIRCHNGYQKRKAQKAKTKEELMSIA